MGFKKCCRCGETKPHSRFSARKENRDGLRGYCKDCDNNAHKKWREENREKFRELARKRYARNPEPAKKQAKMYWRNNKRKQWERNLAKYGITPEDYKAMYFLQGGVCAICGDKCKSGNRLAVDHCHDSGAIRGLLCSSCNGALGLMRDNPDIAANAVEYLIRHSVSKTKVA